MGAEISKNTAETQTLKTTVAANENSIRTIGVDIKNLKLAPLGKTSKTGLQRPAARYDGIGKIGGGYGFLISMVSRVVT